MSVQQQLMVTKSSYPPDCSSSASWSVSYQHPTFRALEFLLPRTLWSDSLLKLRSQFTLVQPPHSPSSPSAKSERHSKSNSLYIRSCEPSAPAFHDGAREERSSMPVRKLASASQVQRVSQELQHEQNEQVDVTVITPRDVLLRHRPRWSLVALHRRFTQAKFLKGFDFLSKMKMEDWESGSLRATSPSLSLPGKNQSKENEILGEVERSNASGKHGLSNRSQQPAQTVCGSMIKTYDRDFYAVVKQGRQSKENEHSCQGWEHFGKHCAETSPDIRQLQRQESQSPIASLKLASNSKKENYSILDPFRFRGSPLSHAPLQTSTQSRSSDGSDANDFQKHEDHEEAKSSHACLVAPKDLARHHEKNLKLSSRENPRSPKGRASVEFERHPRYLSHSVFICGSVIEISSDDKDPCCNTACSYRDSEEALGNEIGGEFDKKRGEAGKRRRKSDGEARFSGQGLLLRKNDLTARSMLHNQTALGDDMRHLSQPHESPCRDGSEDEMSPPLHPFSIECMGVVDGVSISEGQEHTLDALYVISQVLASVEQTHLSRCPLCSSPESSLRWYSRVNQAKKSVCRSRIECSDRYAEDENAPAVSRRKVERERRPTTRTAIISLVAYQARVESDVAHFLAYHKSRVERLLGSMPNTYREYAHSVSPSNSASKRWKADHALLRRCRELGGVELLEALMIGLCN